METARAKASFARDTAVSRYVGVCVRACVCAKTYRLHSSYFCPSTFHQLLMKFQWCLSLRPRTPPSPPPPPPPPTHTHLYDPQAVWIAFICIKLRNNTFPPRVIKRPFCAWINTASTAKNGDSNKARSVDDYNKHLRRVFKCIYSVYCVAAESSHICDFFLLSFRTFLVIGFFFVFFLCIRWVILTMAFVLCSFRSSTLWRKRKNSVHGHGLFARRRPLNNNTKSDDLCLVSSVGVSATEIATSLQYQSCPPEHIFVHDNVQGGNKFF